MSKTIDSKVVEMQFDNRQFESNVKTTMSTLDKLKDSLGFKGASKGLETIGGAVRNIDMSTLSGAVETVRLRFSALEVIAITALTNITNSVINTGKRMLSSLTIAPVKEGFQEYEMVLGAIQTTMAGTGKTADEVAVQLQRLDKYADDTVYSTGDMLSNLPKFTNAGVELEKATTAMIGIANATALAGGDARSASSAFYNLGQSIGTGYLTRMDYNSINNAGIATMEWKNQMVDAAIAQGKLTKSGEDAYIAGNKTFTLQSLFIDGLQEQWASADVMMKVFQDYGDVTTEIGKKAQSSAQDLKTFTMMMDSLKATAGTGWKDTWELIFGDLEEAKVLWTGLGNAISDMITGLSKSRNELLQGWSDLGGRTALIDSFKNAFSGLASVIKPIKEAFRNIFPPTTSKQLYSLTEGLKTLTSKLTINEKTADKIKRTFAGLFAVLDMVKDGFIFVIKVAGEAFGLFSGPTAGGILDITARLGDFLVSLRDAAKAGDIFTKSFNVVKFIFTTVADKIESAITSISNAFKGFKKIDMGPLEDFSQQSEKNFKPLTRIVDVFKSAFGGIVKVLEWASPIVGKLASIVGTALGKLGDKVSYAVENMEFDEILDLINTGLFAAILLGIKNFINGLTEITSGSNSLLGGLTDILDGVRGSLQAYQSNLKAKTLLTIASAIAILAAALVAISLIDSDKLAGSLLAISGLFIELSTMMMVLGKSMKGVKVAKITGQLVGMSVAILILSTALKKLGELDWDELAKGVIGIGALAAVLVASSKLFDKNLKKLTKGAAGLIAFSAAILILSKAVEPLAKLSWEELSRGLTGLTVILAEVVAVTKLMGNPKHMISTGIGMIALAAAMNIFALAIEKMGNLKWDQIARGLTTMAGALVEVTLAARLLPKDMVSKSAGMILMGAALSIIADAVLKFSGMSWDEIGRGLTVMAGALASIVVALNLLPKNIIGTAAGLTVMSLALLIMAEALDSFGDMTWDEIGRGLVVMAGALLIMGVAMAGMTGGLPGAAAMVVMAVAINMLTPALEKLGSMDLKEIGLALLALVGVFAVVGVAGLLLAPLTPAILALAAAIALLGVGVLAIGAGLLLFASGLAALAVSGTAGAAALVVIVSSLISLIPMILEKIGEGIIAFANVIINGMPVILEAVRQIALGLIDILIEVTPPVVEALLTFLVTLLEQLVTAVPKMVDAGMKLILGILEGIAAHIKDVVVVALEIIAEFLKGIAEGLPDVIKSAVDVVVAFLTAIGEETPRVIDAGFKMMIDFINGLADSVRENGPIIGDAMGNLAGAMIEGLIGGITAGVSRVVDTVKNLGASILTSFKEKLGIHSPAKEFIYLAKMIGEGVVIGIDNSIGPVGNSISRMTDKIMEVSEKGFDEFESWLSDRKYFNELSLKEELFAWEKIQERYLEGSEERKKADREVYRLQQELVRETYNYSMEWISERKYYNDLTMTQELDAYKRVQTRYMKGTDERKKADREVYRLENEINEARKNHIDEVARVEEEAAARKTQLAEDYYWTVKDINAKLEDDIRSLEESYSNAISSRAKSIYGAFNLFDAIPEKDEVIGTDLLDNLQAQVNEVADWRKNIDDLTSRGISAGLMEEIQEMGPASLNQIKALNSLSDDELTKYSELWATKHQLARDKAVDELSGLRLDTNRQIKALREESEIELDYYYEMWQTNMEELEIQTNLKVSELKENFTKTIGELRTDTETEIKGLTETSVNTIKDAPWTEAGETAMTETNAGVVSKTPLVVNSTIGLVTQSVMAIRERYPEFYNAGKYMVEGFAEGITKHTFMAAARAKAMAAAAVRAAEKELDINSPSRVSYSIGSFFGKGFVNALTDYASKSYKAGSEIAKSAKDGLSNAISKINELVEGDIDTQPTIRPVLDLSDIQAGTNKLDTLFSQSRASSIDAGMNRTSGDDILNGETNPLKGNSFSFTQNNYSPKPLSRLDIYRQTKNQFSAMKGLVEA